MSDFFPWNSNKIAHFRDFWDNSILAALPPQPLSWKDKIWAIFFFLQASLKGEDPYGRIGHNYNYKFYGFSLNDILMDNSVSYILFKYRVRFLSQLT